MNNHIFLMLKYLDQLTYLAKTQLWLDGAKAVAKNPKMIELLDTYQTQVVVQKIKLHDEMFEIARSN